MLTVALFVNLLNFLFNSVKIGPSRNLSNVMTLWSLSSCAANSTTVGGRGSNGGAIGSSSSTLFLLCTPSANSLGRRLTSLSNPSKKALRAFTLGNFTSTSCGPNHARTSGGRASSRPSTTARSRIGSVGESVSSIERTIERDVSDTAAHHPNRDGMYITEG
jgi:hypothetical protein